MSAITLLDGPDWAEVGREGLPALSVSAALEKLGRADADEGSKHDILWLGDFECPDIGGPTAIQVSSLNLQNSD